jgi:hypothetical protein
MWWCIAALAIEPGPVAAELASLPPPERLTRLGGLLASSDPSEIEVWTDTIAVARALDPSLPPAVVENLLRSALDPDPRARLGQGAGSEPCARSRACSSACSRG